VLACIHPDAEIGVFAADKETGSIVGTVVAEGGGASKPVANAEVRLTFGSKADGRRTGADGKFSFADLLPGKYTVRVVPPDGLKPKGDGVASVTIAAGGTERIDLALVAAAPTATPTPAPKATATPSPKPAAGQATGSQSTASNGAMPVLVVPYGSPGTVAQASPGTTTSTGTSSQPASTGPSSGSTISPSSGVQSVLAPAAGVASPGPLDMTGNGLIFASSSPTPQASPTGTRTPSGSDDVLASGPPRRLITSFQSLRDTTGSGAVAQLKSWATDTSLVLGVPFRTQIDGTSFSLVNCGPASLAMVLVAFGMDVDPPSVRDYLNYKVGNFNTEQGTSLYTLAQIAREAGLNTFGTSAGLQGWTVGAVREQIRAGHPVITLTKYRRLPGHFGSVTEFDHYIVITGLAGDDFVYNDAAYSTEYGHNLLISGAQLEQAWAGSSVPRHAVAIGYGDSLRPLPIVPNRLTAESLASTMPAEDAQVVAEAPIRVIRGPAAEWLREQMLDSLGARTAVVDGDLAIRAALAPPLTRLDPQETANQERPSGAAVSDATERARAEAALATDAASVVDAGADQSRSVESVADARGAPAPNGATGRIVRVRPDAGQSLVQMVLTPLGLVLISVGLVLTVGGGAVGWRRGLRLSWAASVVQSPDWRRTLATGSSTARQTATLAARRLVVAARRVRPSK